MTEDNIHQDIDPTTVYELKAVLGEGSFGCVYKATKQRFGDKKEYAIKIIPINSSEDTDDVYNEMQSLQKLSCPFVVSFVESFLYEQELWLVLELCDGGSLQEIIELMKSKDENFTEVEIRAIIVYCLLGLEHLHDRRSIHRDIKSGNILLTSDGKAKLGDFGIVAHLSDKTMKRRTVIGSPYYMAPEIIQESSYDEKVDIWSIGITIIELCEGRPPHSNLSPMRAIFAISKNEAPILHNTNRKAKGKLEWSAVMIDFVSKCLVKDSIARSSVDDLLSHPWIARQVTEILSSVTSHDCGGMSELMELTNRYKVDVAALRAAKFKASNRSGGGTTSYTDEVQQWGNTEKERDVIGNDEDNDSNDDFFLNNEAISTIKVNKVSPALMAMEQKRLATLSLHSPRLDTHQEEEPRQHTAPNALNTLDSLFSAEDSDDGSSAHIRYGYVEQDYKSLPSQTTTPKVKANSIGDSINNNKPKVREAFSPNSKKDTKTAALDETESLYSDSFAELSVLSNGVDAAADAKSTASEPLGFLDLEAISKTSGGAESKHSSTSRNDFKRLDLENDRKYDFKEAPQEKQKREDKITHVVNDSKEVDIDDTASEKYPESLSGSSLSSVSNLRNHTGNSITSEQSKATSICDLDRLYHSHVIDPRQLSLHRPAVQNAVPTASIHSANLESYSVMVSRPTTSSTYLSKDKMSASKAPKFNITTGVRVVTMERRLTTRRETEQLLAHNLITRNERKEELLHQRMVYENKVNKNREDTLQRWTKKTEYSPFTVKLLEEDERIFEERRIRLKDEQERAAKIKRMKEKAREELYYQTVTEGSAVDDMRQEKRKILDEEQRLKALASLERKGGNTVGIRKAW